LCSKILDIFARKNFANVNTALVTGAELSVDNLSINFDRNMTRENNLLLPILDKNSFLIALLEWKIPYPD
jgi:hypothetical protein